MTVWLLDDGPFGLLGRHFNAGWRWPPATLHVVAEVAAAARLDQSGRRQRLLSLESEGQKVIEVHAIAEASPTADFLFSYLRPDSSSATKDLGEHASIAFAAIERADAIFVTMDKGAAYLALAELGPGRVATAFDVWADLRLSDLVTREESDSLHRATQVGDESLRGIPRRLNRR